MDKVEALMQEWPDWPQRRSVHPIEAEKLPESVYLLIIIFFVIFSVLMVLLFILVIMVGIYRSVTDSSRKIDSDRRRLMEV